MLRVNTVRRSGIVKILLALILFVTVICPLITMLVNIMGADIFVVLRQPRFREALRNSIFAAATATLISVTFAWFFALCVVRSKMRYKEFFTIFVTLPMLIPSISHGLPKHTHASNDTLKKKRMSI